MKGLHLSLWATLLLLLIHACSDPTLVGSDLLDSDRITVEFTDTIRVVARTTRGDSVRTYAPNFDSQINTYLFGDMSDPVFGRSVSSIYFQPLPEVSNPDFFDIRIDSVILVLPYDTNAFYGNTEAVFGMDIFELDEIVDRSQEFYSDQTFLTKSTPITSVDFQPKRDSLAVVDFPGMDGEPDSTSYPAHLRIPLGIEFGQSLTRLDPSVYARDSIFVEFFNGIHLRPTTSNEGMLSFDLKNSTLAGIHLYYVKDDSIPRQFQYRLLSGSGKLTNFEHDYSGSPVEDFIDDENAGESFLFVQGMAGTDVTLEFPDLSDFKEDVIVNQAILEVTVADFSDDPEGIFDPCEELILSKRNEDGGLELIDDLQLIVTRGLSREDLFGGQLEEVEDTGTLIYTMNLSGHFQNILDGVEPNQLIISVFPRPERANRSILFGTAHPENAINLKLAITRL
ncbi:MAG: DUF4270 family protein [Bacteroidota bacterium]